MARRRGERGEHMAAGWVGFDDRRAVVCFVDDSGTETSLTHT